MSACFRTFPVSAADLDRQSRPIKAVRYYCAVYFRHDSSVFPRSFKSRFFFFSAILFPNFSGILSLNVYPLYNLCPWSSETEYVKTHLEHIFAELPNIYGSRGFKSVSKFYGQRMYNVLFVWRVNICSATREYSGLAASDSCNLSLITCPVPNDSPP
jgi:hypothetical protein